MKNIVEDLLHGLFNTIWSWIVEPFVALFNFTDLIYGADGELAYGVFTLDEIEKIYTPGMNIAVALAIFVILISIVYAGMKISSAGINPGNRTYAIDYFKKLAIVGILFFNLSTLYQLIFGLNYIIVDAFYDPDVMIDHMFDFQGVWERFKSAGILGGLIIGLVMLGLSIWANWYYMMRKITLLIFMILGPLMLALALIPQTRQITTAWFKELVGTVFVQSIHAILYWITSIVSVSTTGIETIILYITFIPIAESLRSLFGLGGGVTSTMSKMGAMFGLSGLAGVGSAVKGALDGKSFGQALKDGYQAIRDRKKNKNEGGDGEDSVPKSGVLNNVGTDTGTTARAERMLRAGQILSKGGKAVFGAAGSIAGMPMGPLGSMALGTVGFHVGGVAGGVAGRAGMALAEGGFNLLKKGFDDAISTYKNMTENQDEALAEAIADAETTNWANANKDTFMEQLNKESPNEKGAYPDLDENGREMLWQQEVAKKYAENLDKARATVAQIKKSSRNVAKATDLVNSATDELTNDWAKSNEDQFKKDYDAKLPPPTNETERQQHEITKQKAWEHEVQQKRNEIHKVVSATATKMTNGAKLENAYLDKSDFAEKVGTNIGSIIGKGDRSSIRAVLDAVSGVKTGELIQGRTVNQDLLANQLASTKTAQARQQYINSQKDKDAAAQYFDQNMAQQVFQDNFSQVRKSVPKSINLSDRLTSGAGVLSQVMEKPGVRKGIAVGAALVSGVTGATGITGVAKVLQDNKLGAAIKSAATELFSRPTPSTEDSTQVSGSRWENAKQEFKNTLKHYTPTNAIQKQAAFRNAVAYTFGVVGGVGGYKVGAKIAAGGQNWQNLDGSSAFKWNPYNKVVNEQTSEVSEIQQMVQTQTVGGQAVIPQGAIRMVQSREGTVLQVRDKAGQIRTVSRIGSGDSTLKKGQVIYQDLDIRNGELVLASNVYKEDSGGGRIALNRSINVNPNRLVANRNTPKTPRIVHEIESYNQFVDSGQFTQQDAIKEVTDIRLVVTRNNSFLVGKKDGKEVRISPYGKGDTRLQQNEVAYRTCEIQNKEIVTVEQFSVEDLVTNKKIKKKYSSTIKPSDLLAKYPPNPRLRARKRIEQERNKAFTEPLR